MRSMLAAAAFAAVLANPPPLRAEVFEFVALGDMPYTSKRLPDSDKKFGHLIAAVNRIKPAFSIHVGDIKSGSTSCENENLEKILAVFGTFEQPLVYTPGDNEWTDCHRSGAGGFDPLERLRALRAIFFAKPDQSLGRNPMPVESQARVMPGFMNYVENARFEKSGVLFVTVHVVGSNNNLDPQRPAAVDEFRERDMANVAWLADSFKLAGEKNLKAVVIAMQADPYEVRQAAPGLPLSLGFLNTIRAIKHGAESFKKPILVIHGDTHRMELARFLDIDMTPVTGVWRLEVMGEEDVHAIRVTVDTEDPGVFGFRPLIVPENGRY